jgi:hypothetical protein
MPEKLAGAAPWRRQTALTDLFRYGRRGRGRQPPPAVTGAATAAPSPCSGTSDSVPWRSAAIPSVAASAPDSVVMQGTRWATATRRISASSRCASGPSGELTHQVDVAVDQVIDDVRPLWPLWVLGHPIRKE